VPIPQPEEKKKIKKPRKASKIPPGVEETTPSKTPPKVEQEKTQPKEVKMKPPPAAVKQEAVLPPQPPMITAKEKKRLRLEKERERERELFEKNFKASDLMISRMGLNV
jgi:hypothetical protein